MATVSRLVIFMHHRNRTATDVNGGHTRFQLVLLYNLTLLLPITQMSYRLSIDHMSTFKRVSNRKQYFMQFMELFSKNG